MKSKYLNYDYSISDISETDLKRHIKNMSKIINAYILNLERNNLKNYAYTSFKKFNKDLLTKKERVKSTMTGNYTELRHIAQKYQTLIGKRKSIKEIKDARKKILDSFRTSDVVSVNLRGEKNEKLFLQFIESGAFESYKNFISSERIVEAFDTFAEEGVTYEDIIKGFELYKNNEIESLNELYGKYNLNFTKIEMSRGKK